MRRFIDILKKCAIDGRCMRRVGLQRRNGSECWSEEVGVAMPEKRSPLWNCFREEIGETGIVKVAKRMTDRRRWRGDLGMISREIKKYIL